MKVILPDEKKLLEQIEEFNLEYSTNCSLLYTNNTVFPDIYEGIIKYNKNVLGVFLLFNILMENEHFLIVTFLYNLIIQDIKRRQFLDTDKLISILLELFEENKDSISHLNYPVLLDMQIGALMAHELCHQKLLINKKFLDDEYSRVYEFLKSLKPAGFRGILSRYYINKLIKNKTKIIELICDNEIAKFFIKYINNTANNNQNFKQIIYLFHAMEFSNYIGEIKMGFNTSGRIKRNIFATVRALMLSEGLTNDLPEEIIDNIFEVNNRAFEKTHQFINSIISNKVPRGLFLHRFYLRVFHKKISEQEFNHICSSFNDVSTRILNYFSKKVPEQKT